MLHQFLTYKNLILHLSLSLTLTLLLTFLKLPIFFLYNLHTYIHPDHIPPGSARAAIRRPDSDSSNPELRKRPKSKSKNTNKAPDFDENNAQIFRLKLDEAHLQTRLYFPDYSNAFTFSVVAVSSLGLQIYLNPDSSSSSDSDSSSDFLINASFVPVLLGFAAVSKLVAVLGKVSAEKSASRRSEKQLSAVFGVVGLVVASLLSFKYSPSVLDFDFEAVDGNGRLFVAVSMGCLAGFLFMPAAKSARAFWLGTDQIRSDLSMLSCEWFGRMVLYVNHGMIVFTVLLWINPLGGMLVNKNGKVRNAEGLFGNVGFTASDFGKFRLCCLLVSCFMQLVALRPNLQMYLNEALLCWYQRLHAGKVPDLEYSRAKVFLHNHYLCLVVLQFLAPPVLLLLFLGLSRVEGISSDDYQYACSILPCSAFVREVAVFLAWWILFVWAVYSSAAIFLYRCCILYMS
ncbi:PREDICTED: transmembrane protein 161B [Fragaria vesca subsp. vesca]|uniref:transmembrane protein 161B n=1 Tax=Fragaria vesca subsp. vesca TaxID=101020 RepID=UPI0002C334D7|nr:PREDICTED: transmembrane protein 161B [Fragaria vesca subsp. vesca]